MNLTVIYEGLITELVNNNLSTITQAINDKRLINIYYDDDRTGLTGWRRVEPFAVGRNKYGNDVLRAWQEHGVSASYPPGKTHDPLTHVPGWRMFRLDKITNINTAGNDRFTEPKPKYNPADKDMATVYAAADFGGQTTPNPTNNNPVNPTAPQQPTPSTTQPVPSPNFTTHGSTGLGTTNPKTGYAGYGTTPQEPEKKASMFDKWADKFKKLVGYKPK